MSEDAEMADVIEVEDARELVARREVRVIDIRSAEEFAEERLFGSTHADPDEVEEEVGEGSGPERVVLVCADGSSSAELAERLREAGHEVSSLEGGFGAWSSKRLPLAPGRDEEYEGPAVTMPGAVASESGPDEDEGEARPDEDGGERGEAPPQETAERAEDA